MTTTIQINTELWKKFAALAQQQRKRPNRLLEKLVAEYLEIQRGLQLDEAIRKQAKRSGIDESNAVELVKRYRLGRR